MRRFPNEIQPNTMDCGPTCLRIISLHYGKSYSLSFLRKICGTGKDGTSLLGLGKAAEKIGLRTLAVKIDFNKLINEAPLPFIIHWNQDHFIVVYKVTKNMVYISDPGQGLVTYTHNDFITAWIGYNAGNNIREGIALLIEVTPSFYEYVKDDTKEEHINIAAFLLHYILPHRRLMLQVLLSLITGSLLMLLFPLLTQNIVDVGINTKSISFIWIVLCGQLMIAFGQMSLDIIRTWTLLHISRRISISLISDFFSKLMKLPIRFFDTKLSGDIMQRISDHGRIQSFLTNTTISTIFSLFSSVLYGCILIYYSFTLFTVSIAGSALYLLWISIFLKKRKKIDYKQFHQSAQTNSKIFELINGMQELKLHNAEQQKRWEWERIQVKLYKISIESLNLEQIQGVGSRIINEVKNILITIISASLVIDGKMTLGMMLAVSYIIGQLNGPVLQLVSIVRAWQDARISFNRLAEIHEKENETQYRSGETIVENDLPIPANHTLQLENVCFRYDDLSDDVLKKISLVIPACKVTAIVGSSGSGKTTLLKLLMRYYQPTNGKIVIGNSTDLNMTDLHEWRHKCGVVMQEGFIFNDTIAGNIAVGEDMPDINRIIHAAELANIKEFIESLPRGYNTKIGTEGVGVSTGQKQRILIARAIYKNPEIIFFDEATSSLDANNEKEIMEHLKLFYQNKTVIIIAHRLSTVRDADNIIVLEKGEITEEGTHDNLIAKRGYYYNLVKNQLELSL